MAVASHFMHIAEYHPPKGLGRKFCEGNGHLCHDIMVMINARQLIDNSISVLY